MTPEMETSFVQAKTNEKPEWNFVIKKEIMEMETHYNILADRLKMQDRGI